MDVIPRQLIERCALLAVVGTVCVSAHAAEHAFVFRDVGDEAGLFPSAAGIKGHAAAWGDVDSDGRPDLYVGGYNEGGSTSNMLFRNTGGHFQLDGQMPLRVRSMTSGAVLADFDNDGDLDLYVSDNVHERAARTGITVTNCVLFRNDGKGQFTDVTEGSGLPGAGFKGRGVALLDFDGDGLLDLATCEEYYGEPTRQGVALYRNKGGLRFGDVAATVGLPTGLPVSGVAAADANNDTWPDLFVVDSRGANRLLLNDSKGCFKEAPGTEGVFTWQCPPGDSDYPAGVAFGDVNGDGWLDIVIGEHFKRPWMEPVPVRLYLSEGMKEGRLAFKEVTDKVGLSPLPMKAPHVEFQDFDNDGRPDLFASMVKFADGHVYPLIYRNLGIRDGLPQFSEDVLAVNDFPTPADRAGGRPSVFFDKMIKDGKVLYMAAAPSCDYDRDGRLDLFMANWWMDSRSLLLHNETPGGNWLGVRVRGGGRLNTMGIGCRVNVFAAGHLGEPSARLGCQDISAGYGYCSGQEALAHFGLGNAKTCDVEIVLPHGGKRLERKGVPANQMLEIETAASSGVRGADILDGTSVER